MQQTSKKVVEDEIELRPPEGDAVSLSPSMAVAAQPQMKLGMEKEVKFRSNQEKGEREARNYILENLEFHDLQDTMDQAAPYDDRIKEWKRESEEKYRYIKSCQAIRETMYVE